MNRQLQLGLIIEGNATHSEILRLPSLVEELGLSREDVARRVAWQGCGEI